MPSRGTQGMRLIRHFRVCAETSRTTTAVQAAEKTSSVRDAREQLLDNRIRSLLSLSAAPPPGKACVCRGTARLMAHRPSGEGPPQRCRHQLCCPTSAHPRGSEFVPVRCRGAPIFCGRLFIESTTARSLGYLFAWTDVVLFFFARLPERSRRVQWLLAGAASFSLSTCDNTRKSRV